MPKWTFPIGGQRALQITPVVVDGVMYVTAVNEARALDARNRPPDLALQPAADAGVWCLPETRRPESIEAWRFWAIACFFRPITRTCSRLTG